MAQNFQLMVSSIMIVQHNAFENRNNLNELLYDGIHLSAQGVALYTDEIKNCINNSSKFLK